MLVDVRELTCKENPRGSLESGTRPVLVMPLDVLSLPTILGLLHHRTRDSVHPTIGIEREYTFCVDNLLEITRPRFFQS